MMDELGSIEINNNTDSPNSPRLNKNASGRIFSNEKFNSTSRFNLKLDGLKQKQELNEESKRPLYMNNSTLKKNPNATLIQPSSGNIFV
jgi:hypothetical protein